MVNPNNTRDAYLVMKFGTEALAVANVNENGNYAVVTQWWAQRDEQPPGLCDRLDVYACGCSGVI